MYNKQSVDSALTDINYFKYNAELTDANDAYINKKITRYICTATKVANLPDTSSVWLLETNASTMDFSSSNYGYQIAVKQGSGIQQSQQYMRIKYNATLWGDWEKIITESSTVWKNDIKTLDNNADLNTLSNVNTVQIYRCGYSTNRVNAPQNWYGGILISSVIGGFGFQIAFTYNSTGMYIRTLYNGTWNAWKIL